MIGDANYKSIRATPGKLIVLLMIFLLEDGYENYKLSKFVICLCTLGLIFYIMLYLLYNTGLIKITDTIIIMSNN